jgi:hypothetical protein
MSIKSRRGRASIVALGVVAAVGLLAAISFAGKSKAQTSVPPPTYLTFGPVQLPPKLPGDSGGSTSALIALLLPAVQRGTTPFAVELVNQDTDKVLQFNGPVILGDPTAVELSVSIMNSATGAPTHQMVITSLTTGAKAVLNTAFTDVTVRVIPAVQNNARVNPMSASVTVSGFFGDGSVRFSYGAPVLLLPAV